MYKSVFIIFFQGDQLKSRVKKICEGFRATLYPCPETPAERREMAIGVMTRIEDLNTILGQTQDHRHRVLVAAAKNIKNWFVKVRKIKVLCQRLLPLFASYQLFVLIRLPGNLPHFEPVQFGCDAEVLDRRVLDSCGRPGDDPHGVEAWHCKLADE